jgi:hypothetical protein
LPKDDAEERAKQWADTVKAFRTYLKEEVESDEDKVTRVDRLLSCCFF